MEINVSREEGTVPVSVVHVKGDLDASSYLALVDTTQKLYEEGVRHLLLDLTDLDFISSAGLASLHILIKMFRGESADFDGGQGTSRAMERQREGGFQKSVKLLNPSHEVDRVLETVGFKQFFDVFKNLDEAVLSFGQT